MPAPVPARRGCNGTQRSEKDSQRGEPVGPKAHGRKDRNCFCPFGQPADIVNALGRIVIGPSPLFRGDRGKGQKAGPCANERGDQNCRRQCVLRRVGKGKPARIDPEKLNELAQAYDQHAAFEDAVVIPMARFLLSPS